MLVPVALHPRDGEIHQFSLVYQARLCLSYVSGPYLSSFLELFAYLLKIIRPIQDILDGQPYSLAPDQDRKSIPDGLL